MTPITIENTPETMRATMNILQKRINELFMAIMSWEDITLMRAGVINLYRSIIQMAEYRIKVLTEVKNGENKK